MKATYLLIIILLTATATYINVQSAEAEGTIYIRADGSIDPPAAPISSFDNITYVFTDSIVSVADGLVVERDSAVVDGAGFLLSGPANSYSIGVSLSQRFNVTVKNLEIASFGIGVKLNSSSKITLAECRIWSEYLGKGVLLQDSSWNNITENWLEKNRENIQVYGTSSYNIFSGNNITRSYYGVALFSSDNSLFGNNITWSDCGLYVCNANNIGIIGNNITHNINATGGTGHGAWGLHVENCNSSIVTGNNMTDSEVVFEMNNSYNNLISQNNVSRNSGTPHAEVGSGHVFSENNFENNTSTALGIFGMTNASVTRNTFVGNMESAIRLDGSNIIVTENNITNTRKSVINRAYAINGENLLNSTISRNNIYGNGDSVYLQNISGTHFSDNYLTDNGGPVLYVLVATNCYFSGNDITNSLDCGIKARGCNNSLFSENEIENNSLGIMLELSYYNKFYRNNLLNNTQQVYATDSANYWDDDYPSGGNYWSDYAGSDLYSGPFQNETGSDGLGDVPYFIDDFNQDNYPIMSPMQPLQGDINGDSTVDIFDVVIVALAFSSTPSDPNWNVIADINSDNVIDIFDLVVVALHFGETI